MKYMNFLKSVEFLESNNIKCLKNYIINTKKDLKKFVNYPYVLKLSSSLLHKTDAKAVKKDLISQEDLEKAYSYLKDLISKKKIDGDIVLQKQKKGIELIIGISEDPQFGKTLLFGQGGIFTEKMDDASIRVLPVSKKDIDNMIRETKVYKILKGARSKKYDLKELKDFIYKIANLAKEKDIKDLDINPLIINPKGLYVVDVRVAL